MKFRYDKRKDALAIRFADDKYAESDEVQNGVIFDYDANGKILGIEILDASKKLAPAIRRSLLHQEIALQVGSRP